ncbi:LysR substrate-binding domain-containing protein [Ascidiaceihabitans sp.]|uniref:LysR substrate-binding domain-containing protein n=1 Tax=Ascidiaceihabitans sp. TaxID=1872644 RepID=UPI00329754D4
MSRNLPPLNALRAFEAAGRHQSFTRAAEELSVNHSAISRHVRGLEHRLGVHLFRDLPRGVELSDEGRAYLGRITAALDMVDDATEDLAETPEGRVTLNSEPLFAQKFIVPRMGAFQVAFPKIELRLEASHDLADVDRYEADLAVRFAHRGTLDLPSDLISDGRIFPFAAPSLLKGKVWTAKDILAAPRFRDRREDTWQKWAVAAGAPVPPSEEGMWRLRANLAVEAALEGQGIYLGSQECVAHEVAAGRLVQCSDVSLISGAFHLVCASQGIRRRAVRQVRTWLLSQTLQFRDTGEDQPNG